MAVLRSAQIAAAASSTANQVLELYTVPAGYKAIVRDLRISNNGVAGTTDVSLWMHSSGGTPQVYLYNGPLAAGAAAGVQGDIVMNPGDRLRCLVTASAIQIVVSGAVLPINPP